MNRRLALLAAATAVVALAPSSHAATYKPNPAVKPKPQIVDKSGDAIAGQTNSDIVNAQFSTVGEVSTKKVGRKRVTHYTPKKLVVSLKLAAAPSSQAGWTYTGNADVAGCGSVSFAYSPNATLGEGSAFFSGCGEVTQPSIPILLDTPSALITIDPVVKASTITWELGLKAMPKEVKVGKTWSNFSATVDVNEPVFGIVGPGVFGGHVDSATGSGSWKLS
jgi:hypothetical protein